MNPLDFPLLADENIAPDVVSGLRSRGHDVRSVWDEALVGRPDVEVLETATRLGRVVVTHDVAFGRSAVRAGTSFIEIVYLRPGHISAAFVLEIVEALRTSTVDVQSPFIAIADRRSPAVSSARSRADDTALVAPGTAGHRVVARTRSARRRGQGRNCMLGQRPTAKSRALHFPPNSFLQFGLERTMGVGNC